MSATANLPTLESLVGSVDGVAALPDITLKIVAAAEDPSSDAFRMLKIVSHDPALVTRILKLVNSSFYSLPTKVSSLKHAIAFLGINVVRNMAIASSVATMFRGGDLCEGVTSRDLWQHSIAVAVASRQISQLIHAQFTDDAFLVGMLHDLGLLILHQKQPEDVREICQEARGTGRPFLDLEREALGFDHQQIGGALAEKWKFPESICAAIRFHHEPAGAPPQHRKLVTLTFLADTICSTQPKEPFNLTAAHQAVTPEMLAEVGMTVEQVATVGEKLPELLAAASPLLG